MAPIIFRIYFTGSDFAVKEYIRVQVADASKCESDSIIVCRGDWLGKPANIKVENNGAIVYT